MAQLLGVLVGVVAVAVVLGPFVWLARRVRRSGVGTGLMGPFDEVYNPGAHRSRLDIQVQEQRLSPRATADDLPPGP